MAVKFWQQKQYSFVNTCTAALTANWKKLCKDRATQYCISRCSRLLYSFSVPQEPLLTHVKQASLAGCLLERSGSHSFKLDFHCSSELLKLSWKSLDGWKHSAITFEEWRVHVRSFCRFATDACIWCGISCSLSTVDRTKLLPVFRSLKAGVALSTNEFWNFYQLVIWAYSA